MVAIRGRRFALIQVNPPDPEFDNLNMEENLADHVYYAKNAIKYGDDTEVVNGDSVGSIPDKKGDKPLTYAGNVNLAIINSPPVFTTLSNQESYISALNLPEQQFNSELFSVPIDNPREIGIVLRVTEGQSFEQFQDAFGTGDGFGDNGTVIEDVEGIEQPIGFHVRVANQNAIEPSFIPFYTKTFVQISYGLTEARLWVNGEYQGSVAIDEIEKPKNGVFVGTNNADHQWFAQYHYFRLLEDSERTAIGASIINKWDCNELPQYAYAHNIEQSLSSGIWSTTFLTKNPSGNGVNLALTQYRWIINIRITGGFGYQKVIATTATITNSFLLSEMEAYRIEIGASPSNDQYVYAAVKVFDNEGFGWEYFRGTDYTPVN